MNKTWMALIIAMLLGSTGFISEAKAVAPKVVHEQYRGCCSHHGGICGAQSGRILCCDGRISGCSL